MTDKCSLYLLILLPSNHDTNTIKAININILLFVQASIYTQKHQNQLYVVANFGVN